MHVKITNTDLIREMSSKAVLSTNKSELDRYQRLRNEKIKEQRDKYTVNQRLERLEHTIELLLDAIQTIGKRND